LKNVHSNRFSSKENFALRCIRISSNRYFILVGHQYHRSAARLDFFCLRSGLAAFQRKGLSKKGNLFSTLSSPHPGWPCLTRNSQLNIRIRTASDDRFSFAEINVIDVFSQSVDEAGRPRLKSNDFRDAQPLSPPLCFLSVELLTCLSPDHLSISPQNLKFQHRRWPRVAGFLSPSLALRRMPAQPNPKLQSVRLGDVNYRLSAHLALGDLIRSIAAGTVFIV
jgi:hypothetical protein